MQQLKPVDPSLHAHLEGLTIGEGMCIVWWSTSGSYPLTRGGGSMWCEHVCQWGAEVHGAQPLVASKQCCTHAGSFQGALRRNEHWYKAGKYMERYSGYLKSEEGFELPFPHYSRHQYVTNPCADMPTLTHTMVTLCHIHINLCLASTSFCCKFTMATCQQHEKTKPFVAN